MINREGVDRQHKVGNRWAEVSQSGILEIQNYMKTPAIGQWSCISPSLLILYINGFPYRVFQACTMETSYFLRN